MAVPPVGPRRGNSGCPSGFKALARTAALVCDMINTAPSTEMFAAAIALISAWKSVRALDGVVPALVIAVMPFVMPPGETFATGALAALTNEVSRNAAMAAIRTPAAEGVIRNDMIAGIAAFLDTSFVNAASAPVANVSPGGITNGITAITSAGTTPSNARTDFQALINAMAAANISVEGAVLIMSQTNAAVLASALNPLGQPLFPLLGPTGGTAMGIPVVAGPSTDENVILIQPTTVLYADDGGVTIDASVEASVQIDTVLDSPPVATTILTSLWQNNLVGLRAERYINWKRARNAGVQWTSQTYVLT